MAPTTNRGKKNVYRPKYKKRYNKRKEVAAKNKKTFATNEVVSYLNNRLMPFPPRYRCKLTAAMFGYIAAGVASGTNWSAKMNSPFHPFAGGGWLNGSPAIATNNPAGYDQLLNNNLYNYGRVYSSRITVEFLPQSLSDTVICTVTPSAFNTQPSTVAAALEQPYTKQLFMSSSKMNAKNGSAISNSVSQHKFLGVRHQAIQDDLSGNYIFQDDGTQGLPLFWIVNTAQPDGAVLAQPLEYKVTIKYYVELFAQQNAALIG